MVVFSKAKNRIYSPQLAVIDPDCPKIKIFHFELELNVDCLSNVEFRVDYDGDNFESQKPNLRP